MTYNLRGKEGVLQTEASNIMVWGAINKDFFFYKSIPLKRLGEEHDSSKESANKNVYYIQG